ncbi:MAG: thiamine phosphate synthase [Vicinamibacterales bacterium]
MQPPSAHSARSTRGGLPPLYVICDSDVCAGYGWTLTDFARACFDGGATLLQVRAKTMAGQQLLEATSAIMTLAQTAGATVIVNDRADIALAASAQGVHVGQDDLPPRAIRSILGDAAVVGRSTHTDDQLRAALGEPIDYVATGPVFGTATKDTGYDPRGLESVAAAARLTRSSGMPLVAIGGITLARAASVIEAGAQSVAVISDLLSSGRPDARVREFLRALA